MPAFLNLGILPFVLRVLLFIGIVFFLMYDCPNPSKPKIIQVSTSHEDSVSSQGASIIRDLNYVQYPRPTDFVDKIQTRIISGQDDDSLYVIYPHDAGEIK